MVGDWAVSGSGTLALDDLTAWKGNLATMLPAGDGSIARDAPSGEFTVTVQWKDRDDAATENTQFQMTTIP